MRSQDVYVHADVHGAASVVIRNDAGATSLPSILVYENNKTDMLNKKVNTKDAHGDARIPLRCILI